MSSTIAVVGVIIAAGLAALIIHDVRQRRHAILHNFPILGHFRYWLEAIGPELRQYIVTGNDEERPFSRDQRRWIYASSKREDNYFGFGSDNEMEQAPGYLIIKPHAFPQPAPHPGDPGFDPDHRVEATKVMGAARDRPGAFRPSSVVNISGMSFGSLSGAAIQALNRGAARAGCLHNTGEGGLSRHHDLGADLVWQIGTGYFGCRDDEGRLNLERLRERLDGYPRVRAIELKLSQGAKPGVGGILPRGKISAEIAEIRGVPRDRDCVSPSTHTAFHDADSLLDVVEAIAEATGRPVGIKSAVGDLTFWHDLARLMTRGDRGIDFIAIDGGEGGTGAGPLVFADHVALPFKMAFTRVRRLFDEAGLGDDVVFAGAGKLGFPQAALLAFALGCDVINVGREALMAIGCIQAQRCHTNHCPAGIATQNRWLAAGLDPSSKADRLASYVITLRKELLALSRTCGATHPADIKPDQLELLDDRFGSRTVAEVFGLSSSSSLVADPSSDRAA